jgi:uncharacterized membrane protein
MNNLATPAMIAGFFISTSSAYASLTVTPGLTIHNKCRQDIAVAVRYKASTGNWATAPFTTIRAGQQQNAVVSSNNSIFYYYAEGPSGRWSGDHNVRVGQKIYAMKEKRLELDRQRNRYYLGLTCNS